MARLGTSAGGPCTGPAALLRRAHGPAGGRYRRADALGRGAPAGGAGRHRPALTPSPHCSTGVIVAADFSHWGRRHQQRVRRRRCRPTPSTPCRTPGSTRRGVAGYGLAFICQIAGFPQDDPCTTTPPANAYWSFWYARAGQDTWTYSQSGAMNVAPTAGSVEAWVFGGSTGRHTARDLPVAGFDPGSHRPGPAHPAHHLTADDVGPLHAPRRPRHPVGRRRRPRGPPRRSRRPQSGGGGPAAAAGVGGGSPVDRHGPRGLGSTDVDHDGRGRGRRPRTGRTRRAGQCTPPRPGRALRGSSTRPRRSAGTQAPNSPLPFLIGASAVAVLAGAAGVVAWRRRRTG